MVTCVTSSWQFKTIFTSAIKTVISRPSDSYPTALPPRTHNLQVNSGPHEGENVLSIVAAPESGDGQGLLAVQESRRCRGAV